MLLPVRSHTLAALAVTGAVIAVGGVATADSIDECVLSHRRGQELRQSGAVRAARAALVACGGTACPGPLRDDCVRWVAELDRQIPTLVVAARDAAGRDLTDVAVWLDGAAWLTTLDGVSKPIDPGVRVFRFERASGEAVEKRLTLVLGEQNRSLTITFPDGVPSATRAALGPPARAPNATPSSAAASNRTPALVAAAVGAAGVGSFAFFAVSGQQRLNELRASCAPYCSDDDRSAVYGKFLAADISLAVGVASLGVAAFLLWGHADSSK